MATIAANTFNFKPCLSTLVCPEWTAAAIVDGLQSYGFEGVELRLGKGHLHEVEIDSTPEHLTDVRQQFDEAGAAVACLATSVSFSASDPKARQQAQDELRQCLRVADKLGCPYVRIFGGNIPAGLEVAGVIDYIAESISEGVEYIEENQLRTMLLLETHDTFSHSKYVLEAMSQVYSPKVGVLWDPLNTVRALEKVEATYDQLGHFIRHVHIHEAAFNEDRTKMVASEPGQGVVPLERVIDLLKAGAYRGYLSVTTHREGQDADEILPIYGALLKRLIHGDPEASN